MGVTVVSWPKGFEESNGAFFFGDALACDAMADCELLGVCWIVGLGWRPLKRLEKAGGCGIHVVRKLNGEVRNG